MLRIALMLPPQLRFETGLLSSASKLHNKLQGGQVYNAFKVDRYTMHSFRKFIYCSIDTAHVHLA